MRFSLSWGGTIRLRSAAVLGRSKVGLRGATESQSKDGQRHWVNRFELKRGFSKPALFRRLSVAAPEDGRTPVRADKMPD